MKKLKLKNLLIIAAFVTVASQNAYISSEPTSRILDVYEDSEPFLGNDKLTNLMYQHATMDIDRASIAVIGDSMQSCYSLMEHVGKRLTEISYVDQSFIRELYNFEFKNC